MNRSQAIIARRKFRDECGRCFACGSTRDLFTHEIARGPSRGRAFLERAAWLLTCPKCHDAMGNYAVWPLQRQLALKALADPVWFDLVAVNRMRIFGGDPTRGDLAITQAEVDAYLDTVFETYPACEGT